MGTGLTHSNTLGATQHGDWLHGGGQKKGQKKGDHPKVIA